MHLQRTEHKEGPEGSPIWRLSCVVDIVNYGTYSQRSIHSIGMKTSENDQSLEAYLNSVDRPPRGPLKELNVFKRSSRFTMCFADACEAL